MENIFNKLKLQVEENPLGAVAVGALAVTAVTKLIKTLVETRNSRTWAKEVRRRQHITYDAPIRRRAR